MMRLTNGAADTFTPHGVIGLAISKIGTRCVS